MINRQDTRTKSEYRRYCKTGFKNQEIVITRLREEYNWDAWLLKKEKFEEGFARPYQPDALIGGRHFEIKATTYPISE